jgi:hypothetical protein
VIQMEIASLHGRKKLGLLFRVHCLVPLQCEHAYLLLGASVFACNDGFWKADVV